MNKAPKNFTQKRIEKFLERIGFPPTPRKPLSAQLSLQLETETPTLGNLALAEVLPEASTNPGTDIPLVVDLFKGWLEGSSGDNSYAKSVLTDCVWLLFTAYHYSALNTHIAGSRRELVPHLLNPILALPVTAIPATATRVYFDYYQWEHEDLGLEITSTPDQIASSFSMVLREGAKSFPDTYPNLHDAIIGERFNVPRKPAVAPDPNSVDQLFAMLAEVPEAVQQAILLALFCKLRHRETRFVTWGDISLCQDPPKLNVMQRGGNRTKNGRPRVTAAAPNFLHLFKGKYYRGQELNSTIITPLSAKKDALRMKQTVDFLRSLNLTDSPNLMHYLRKMGITDQIPVFGLPTVSRHAGHASIDLTQKFYVLEGWIASVSRVLQEGMTRFLAP